MLAPRGGLEDGSDLSSVELEGDLVQGTGVQIDDTASVVRLTFRRFDGIVTHRQAVAPSALSTFAVPYGHLLFRSSLFGRPVHAEAVEGGHGQWLGLGGCGGDGLRKTNGGKRRDPNCNEIGPYPQNTMASCFVDHLFHSVHIPTSSM